MSLTLESLPKALVRPALRRTARHFTATVAPQPLPPTPEVTTSFFAQ